MPKLSNEERVDRFRKLAGLKYDTELAKFFKTNQPQISRWRNTGFHKSTVALLDFLLSVISEQQNEINKLKKETKSSQQD